MSAHHCINCPTCRRGCSICGRCACPKALPVQFGYWNVRPYSPYVRPPEGFQSVSEDDLTYLQGVPEPLVITIANVDIVEEPDIEKT